jgi:hypothetical protein
MQQLLPWLFAFLSLALLLGAGVVWALKARSHKPMPLPTDWALTARPVFSTEERRVYRHLREAFPQYIVLSKLPLVRFSQPTDPKRVRYWYELLGAQHVSFAICSANGRVLAAIDLESDRSTSRRSLAIKDAALSACKVRYLRCAPDKLPSATELQQLVPQIVPTHKPAPAVSEARDQLASTLANRRRERSAWSDSVMQDSFFDTDLRVETAVSGYGGLNAIASSVPSKRSGLLVREVTLRPEDIVGAVVDDGPPKAVANQRH